MALKTTYTDSQYSQKEYEMKNNGDGTYSFEDKTIYIVEGDYYGCEDINKQNVACIGLDNDYSEVTAMIAKIQSYGVTVSANNPTAIKEAINMLATKAYTDEYNATVNDAKNHPDRYGLVSNATYNAAVATNTNYTNRINNAKSYLGQTIPYDTTMPQPPIISFYNDPITWDDAYNARSGLSVFINAITSVFNSFFTSANTALNNAYDQLNV